MCEWWICILTCLAHQNTLRLGVLWILQTPASPERQRNASLSGLLWCLQITYDIPRQIITTVITYLSSNRTLHTLSSFRQNVMLVWAPTAKWSNSSELKHSSVSMALDCSTREREREQKGEGGLKILLSFCYTGLLTCWKIANKHYTANTSIV